MEWLNYHHLLYFWTVARLGSVTRARDELRVSQPTISGQLRALEQSVGDKLFVRAGRGLALTETGRTVYRYADEIFSIGRELQDALHGRRVDRPARFVVGISTVLPKLVSHQLLAPALALTPPIQIVCRHDTSERLLADLALHALDLVLADTPVAPGASVRAFSHLLGECGVTFFAQTSIAGRYAKKFPGSLEDAPLLLPPAGSALRRSLEGWFESLAVRPRVVGECDDSALLKVFGQAGLGIVATPSVAEDEIRRQYRLVPVGRTAAVKERFFAITLERRIKHPAVAAISARARAQLFDTKHG